MAILPRSRQSARHPGCCFDLFVDQFVHRRIDAADEKARHARETAGIAAGRGELLERREIGFRDLAVNRAGKKQRDVDIDSFAQNSAESRASRLRLPAP